MTPFTTYCDLPFLDRFYASKPDTDPAFYEEEDTLWIEVNDFLRKHTSLVVNANLEALPEPLLRVLIDRRPPEQVAFDPAAFDNIETPEAHDTLWHVCLLEETTVPHEQLSAQLGTLFLSASDVRNAWKRLGHTRLINVNYDALVSGLQSWNELQPYARPLNAVVLCDRYLLKGKKRIKENVGDLLVSLLPDVPTEQPVDVLIVTQGLQGIDLKDRYRTLERHLQQARPDLDINLCIVNAATSIPETHDRFLFLNYGAFHSGQSLNYFENGDLATKTQLTFYPVVRNEERATVLDKLYDLAKIVDRTKEKIGVTVNVMGTKSNRLLDAAKRMADALADSATT